MFPLSPLTRTDSLAVESAAPMSLVGQFALRSINQGLCGQTDPGRLRGTVQRDEIPRSTAGARQPESISLHRLLVFECSERLLKDLRCPFVRRHGDSVVHPLPVAANRNDPRPPQVGKMARDLRLRAADHLDEIADAEFLVTHQVQNPESRPVPKRLKEPFEIKLRFLGHVYYICIDVSVRQAYILFSRYDLRWRNRCLSSCWIQ